MMVFITHSLKSAALDAAARVILSLFVGLLLAAPGPSAAAATEITQLRVERAEDGVYLSAVAQFELPAVVEDALLKGIAVFFVLEADIYRDRWYWTDPRITSAARTVRLAYQPLTGRWRVNIVSGLITSSSGLRATLNQNYETMAEALSAIQRIARWKIAEAAEVDPDAAYTLDLNFRLDLSQLPRPFQIGVAGQREWTISAQVKDRLRLAPAAAAAGTEGGK
ncbi:MAG: putative proline rich signal peptide protein [Polaromonas sp.]|nr:putative proline rich signal peptide protein [Polaromonas sp.]